MAALPGPPPSRPNATAPAHANNVHLTLDYTGVSLIWLAMQAPARRTIRAIMPLTQYARVLASEHHHFRYRVENWGYCDSDLYLY